ncbi:uncharacterized protein LOC123218967 [Mangifera indica]|uniref:uncharacterized protein LOC123218967 n=1 Tax=Mangifera indica TaxID=29780 RepID=UPI001CFA7397|nr:uncharacterized protein LOC123218967 [Mangifera indica]
MRFFMCTILLMGGRGRNEMLFSFSFLIFLLGASYSQTDRLIQGQVLKDGDQLVSAFGNFRLGFFSPRNARNRYLGIWYYKPKERNSLDNVYDYPYCNIYYGAQYAVKKRIQPVWVANRNYPISDNSGKLIIDSADGNLKILHSKGNPIVITSFQATENTSATLEKNGNFVVYGMYSNGSKRELWQSFDYPTDTLLPGMKLGINLQTGHKWFLQSWITEDSPAQGSFTLGMDPNVTNQLVIWWNGEVLWKSRLWRNGLSSSSFINSQSYHFVYNFIYTTNEQEKYFSYSVNEDNTSFPILKISSIGDLKDDVGSLVTNELDDYRYCGEGYTYYNAREGFMSGEGFQFKDIDNMTIDHCKAKCMKNCSCVAFASTNANNNTGCEIWSRGSDFTDSLSSNYRTIYMEVFENPGFGSIMNAEKKKWWIKLIIGVVVALVVPLLLYLCYRIRRKYKAEEEKWWMSLGIVLVIPLLCYYSYLTGKKLKTKVESIWNRWKLLHELGDNISVSLPITFGKRKSQHKEPKNELKIFDFQVIAAATNNFSPENKLGQGGFGPVYKGQLLDGQETAIKKLSKSSGQGIEEFKNEAKLIAKLQHTNLVRLLGCSLHGGERFLVYEYLPNKSLDFFLFDSSRKNILNMKKRLSIIEGIAQGLIYLHKYSRLKVIHRDLKAGNILLDEQMNPKISDFGMARAFAVNEVEANTKRIVGTHGYMSPEYVFNGVVSMKTDVYSFGVMVLEIVSGKKNNGCYDTERPLNLVGYAWQLWSEGKALELIEETMDESCSPPEVLRYLNIGLLCVQDQAKDRPTMSEVVSMLTNETMVLPAPKKPAFFINNSISEELKVSENKFGNCSANNVTISEMQGRYSSEKSLPLFFYFLIHCISLYMSKMRFYMYTILLMGRRGRNEMLFSFSFLIFLLGASYSQTDRLTPGQGLKDGDQLVSAFGNFRLGFFSPEGTRNRYLGIWYYTPRDRRRACCEEYNCYTYDTYFSSNARNNGLQPVWVANRNYPISDKSGKLIIDSADGNLRILHSKGNPIVITSFQAAGNTSATLEKNGNFVAYEMYSNGSKRELWQSFDYPTDTLLPGMKLGINWQTGHQWFLQSWITYDSPAQGSFTLGIDPNVTNQLVKWWHREVSWKSSLWKDGISSSSFINSETDHFVYTFIYTTNEQETYFNYSVKEEDTSFPILKISSSGVLEDDLGWFITEKPFNYPYCRKDYIYFKAREGFMSGEGFLFIDIDNMTIDQCRAKCMQNCSCVAFASTNRNNNTGCEIWSRGSNFTDSLSGNYRTIYMENFDGIRRPEATSEDFEDPGFGSIINAEKKNWWIKLIIGVVVALMVPLLLYLCYRIRRKYKAAEEKWWMSLGIVLVIPLFCYYSYLTGKKLKTKVESIWNRWKLLHELGDNISVSLPITFGKRKSQHKEQKNELKIFDFQVIAAATNNFSPENKLGQGGFGPVYKGQLLGGQEIAIKKLSKSSGQGIEEFKNEAKLIAKLQHTNLVRLLGCSLHGGERFLVYEYLPNKSLDFFLFDSSKKNILNMKKRLSIIEGIAQGLIYLHKYSRFKVIHRDLKASNILLDDQMNPKISDFGMARAFAVNEVEANTKRIVGTHGYMSPEYVFNGVVSMKTDVYSFGVMVLEIVSGKKNNGCYDTERPLNLVGYAWQLWNEGKALELIEQKMDESCSPPEVLRYLNIGLLCVQDQAKDRPTMSEVVSMLTNETMVLPAPKKPAFFINNNISEELKVSENKFGNCSANNVTISDMEGR